MVHVFRIAEVDAGGEMDTDHIRGVSRSVYGNSYMLEVAAAIAELVPRTTTQKELATLTRIERNLVFVVVNRLEDAGLLKRGQQAREKPLLPTPSVFWHLAAAHLQELRNRD